MTGRRHEVRRWARSLVTRGNTDRHTTGVDIDPAEDWSRHHRQVEGDGGVFGVEETDDPDLSPAMAGSREHLPMIREQTRAYERAVLVGMEAGGGPHRVLLT